ncbi:diguanylate cyclase [Pseudogulbenkiania subflava]|uniref:diguanylate cyclase n=1 Tax=Pseudogulbenkiania subflava DSM 22618 TaxID=1123014 RepID=A0A1Y6BK95_9NEIS|nr:diguanylate cyclase [Pseudogulbenkiania subflava]SMF14306.1 diguanylate cyclase (GGDEF) domain-containing protein [Pseudogulbenkiania subflava DSM 22618]
MPYERRLRSTRTISHPLSILTIVGLMVVSLWFVLSVEQGRNHAAVERNAKTESANLVRAFGEHVARTFDEVDEALLILRQAWLDDRSDFDRKVQFLQSAYPKSLLVQVSVISSDGKLAYSTLDPNAKPVDLSDREHFRVHRDSRQDRLHISKPVKGRVSSRYSIQMTRPILGEGGRFEGVLVISLSPDYFGQFIESIDLGARGTLGLIGTDGIFRARGSSRKLDAQAIGTAVPSDRPFLRPSAPQQGSFEAKSVIDGINRLVTYRRLDGYPMVVSITQPVEDIFAAHERRWFRYRLLAGVISLLMVLGGALLARALHVQHQFRSRLLFVNDSLRTLNDIATQSSDTLQEQLQKALELGCRHLGVEFGIVSHVIGDCYQVESCCTPPATNLKAGDEFELAQTYCSITLNNADVVAIHHMSDSDYAGHPCFDAFKLECYIGSPVLVGGQLYGTVNFSSARPYGRTFDRSDIEFVRLLGRWVGSVIAEERSLSKLRALATTDELTGVLRRGHFTEIAEKEFSRAKRYGGRLSMFLIDLDYFKRINDSFGHHGGDETLKRVAVVFQQALRNCDTIGRLGGEEFAVLLPNTPEPEAQEVAERLRREVEECTIQALSGQIHVTISIGVAELAAEDDFTTIYNRCDAALYEAKHLGRNCVVTSSVFP